MFEEVGFIVATVDLSADLDWLPLEHVDAWRVGEHFVPGLRGGHARRRHRLTRSHFEP
jgi:hypothetical protein